MKTLKRIALVMAGLLMVIQFIRPPRNIASGTSANDIASSLNVPTEIRTILLTSCYDCHSNTTQYPWYAHVQPVAWWLDDHISEGKRELNFSEFGGYRVRRQFIKLEQMVDLVTENEMPLPSYLLLHDEAKLSSEQKEKLTAWATAVRDSMRAIHPADSLERRR